MNPELAVIVKEINKKFGDGTVVLAGNVETEVLPRFKTGSLSLDLALGGGWPGNQISELSQ